MALVAFGVIIALHYTDLTKADFMAYTFITDIRMPLFVLAVFYAGLFAVMGGSAPRKNVKSLDDGIWY